MAAESNAEDDILSSAEGITDNQIQPSASTSFMQIPVNPSDHTYDYGQLPTPPPDQGPTVQLPSMADKSPSYALTSSPRIHEIDIKEVQDEEDVRPEPFWTDSAELGYTVIEVELDNEYTDKDAGGAIDLEVVSVMWDEAWNKGGEMKFPMDYIVEEPLTDGLFIEVGFI